MTNEHSTPALPEPEPEEIRALPDNDIEEREIARYGVTYGAVQINRTVAEKLAKEFVGLIVDAKTDLTTSFLRQIGLSTCIVDLSQHRMRVIAYRMEDNPQHPGQGRVVAICQPLPNRQMEVK